MNLQEQTNRIKILMGLHEESLVAPNGNPSNLSPELYRLVRTPEFKNWFGDWENDPENASKVVDENGEPLVVYHGGSFDINMDVPLKGMHFGTKLAAEQRANDKGVEDLVLSMIDEEDGIYYVDDGTDVFKSFKTKQNAIDYIYNNVISDEGWETDIGDVNITPVFLNIKNPDTSPDRKQHWSEAIKRAESSGKDGIIYFNKYEDKNSQSYIILSSEQVKSAFYAA